ncbi:asparaginase, partial [Arthrobacter sp. GCM10027362]|uniref:asparaginase n=1 Tax=Arthrobacter sp. GCM10027362 TaxID=3273379 RepID=UPI00364550A3
MLETFRASDAAELAVVERNGFIESRHLGSAVVMAADGSVVTELGDIAAPVFPRSTLKPLQALAAMRAGVPLRGAQVALACGSHVGSRKHMEVAAGMLRAAGMTAGQLQCPPAWPADEEALAWLIRTDRGRQRLAFNCSGKHAAFLWACRENGWDTATYLEPNHPMQRMVMETVEEYAGEAISHIAVDGCGAPVPAFSLHGLARAVGRLAKAPSDRHADARAATIATAMVDYPWAVQGHGQENTVVMEELRILAKLGAEGVMVMGTPTGVSVAVKILDGSLRAASLVALTLLAAAGAVAAVEVGPVLDRVVKPVLGRGQ